MCFNAIRLWNEKAHQVTGMSLNYNYEREMFSSKNIVSS